MIHPKKPVAQKKPKIAKPEQPKIENFYSNDNKTIKINLKITPGASKNEITGIIDNRLCVRLAAQPVKGKANESLCLFLSKMLNCPKRDIIIIKGEHSRLKTVALPIEYKEKLLSIVDTWSANLHLGSKT